MRSLLLALMIWSGSAVGAEIGPSVLASGRPISGVLIEGPIAVGDFAKFEAILLRRSNADPIWLAVTQQRSVLRYWQKHHGKAGRFGMGCVIFAHRIIRWSIAIIDRRFREAKKVDSQTRLRVNKACLRALFSSSRAEGA